MAGLVTPVNGIAFVVCDTHGNIATDMVSEYGSMVELYGLKDKDGKPLHYESEAYHLSRWCEANGLFFRSSEYNLQLEYEVPGAI